MTVTRRSTPRQRVEEVFLAHEGHVTANALFADVRRKYPRVGRATVYRALKRMVDEGVARQVDFGEGLQRYESAHGHPRHSHLICQRCHRTSEFLSSDVEALLEEIAAVRDFEAAQTVVQVHGICRDCRQGTTAPTLDGAATKRVFARDALRVAIDTERSGLRFYTRAARITRDAAGRKVFESLAAEEHEHLSTLERRYAELVDEDPELEARPQFLFFKGAAGGLFAEGLEELRAGVNDEQALRIGIACERGSHRFFQRYGQRFDDSEGKRIFLEFADEERAHLELLQRELKSLQGRAGRRRRKTR
ncbi:MAG TPA: transcriptional repressor [Vicinamibacterales bacterium]|jgi:Fur family ferric uptake transcriptional regulator